jgi:hypothetical protein
MKEYTTDHIIQRIALIRAGNNLLWMRLLRIAFQHAPDDARKIMKKITKNDREVSKWTARL